VFDSDAEWIEAPERVDAKTYRGHDGIRESFEHWLAQWGEYRLEVERIEDHGDQVLAVVKEYAEGRGSGASTKATVDAVFTFRESKVIRYREFYDETAMGASIA
jgi:ketosteroid isomerase-like protein